ncbi:hypothetical protein [Kitasatospora sp. NBC_01266]|uniref:hypothetical protein n=1 Tax=Kitasatospora sp. NBC_01266 TaxID=2903572 RepID=UPI002E36F562|nr:hypothetical protein [Kitasatospora sp. NBC_01266]
MTTLMSSRPTRRSGATAATPAPSGTVRGCLRLTLRDGVPQLYLLDPNDFATTTSTEVAYDVRVQTAYLLSLQGHRPDWLAQHLDLPTAAARTIAEHAELSGPAGPGVMPPRS